MKEFELEEKYSSSSTLIKELQTENGVLVKRQTEFIKQVKPLKIQKTRSRCHGFLL